MDGVRFPTTEQLHAHSMDMYRLSMDWPYASGTALALVPGAVHELRIQRVAYRFFTTTGPKPRKFFGGKAIDYQVHRVSALLMLQLRDTPELLLMDVIGFHWDAWRA